ncbi:MAG TPA: 1-acyl-sn-glycerol-3-phosphate acyltransferase [Myxococcota bacterium]|nr:1-acyl-sn-glycerol-3-phosphate acyltransferase [Myxococcota bacterium]
MEPTTTLARSALHTELAHGLADWGAGERDALIPLVDAELRGFPDEALARCAARIRQTEHDWGFHPADPVARVLSRLGYRLVMDGSELLGLPNLAVAHGRPVFFVANHLSFGDANVVDQLLVSFGQRDIADKLTVLVGPKVYASPTRRLASMCFGAIKIPQSQSRASGEAVMPRREVARLAVETLACVARRHAAGDHVLIFVEGTRSRTGAMQRVLAASARYFEGDDALVVPIGLWETEKLVPLASERVFAHPVRARVGAPVSAAELAARVGGRRPVIADALGYLIAALLPPEYRGVYGEVGPFEPAHAAAASFSA